MKLYRGVEVNLQATLTSALDDQFTPRILQIGGWEGSRVGSVRRDDEEKDPSPGKSNPDRVAHI